MIDLNPAQRAAVQAPDGPALVLAGAGSGKTRVIVERIVWLIRERGVDPRNILALTFTNRAADEMRGRIAKRLDVERLASWVGTFHAFGLFILRREIDKLGRKRTFTVFDDSDQLSTMKRLVKALPGPARVTPREALDWISRLKQDLADPAQLPPTGDSREPAFRALWKQYHAALEAASAADFDDLLVLAAKLLEEFPDVREKYRSRFQHVLVDEYQDTNRAQYRIARALTGETGNLFVVGDEDQAIYSWRGADIRNILDFAKDFPAARTYRLEQNYRSTAPILDAANAVVTNNAHRLGKTLWTDRKDGDRVLYHLAADAEDEARFVLETIVKRNLSPRDTAVLFRTNGQARVLEEACRRRAMNYVVIGGTKFYARKEIKDILAYLRLLVNPADDEALRRIVNVPPRGIGEATLERLEQIASARNTSLFDALRVAPDDAGLPARTRNAAQEFVALIDTLAIETRDKPVRPIVERLLADTGYREFVAHSDEKDFRTRLEVVDEFLASCEEHDARGGGLLEFLQDLALVSDVDEWRPDTPALTLMTCHGAKGLEFDHVFLIGLEEGLLPHGSALESEGAIEEERRLCYVAMTRARRTLILTSAERRQVYGEHKDREPSRFLSEIPPKLLQIEKPGPASRTSAAIVGRVDPSRLKMGARVRHGRFGKGTVMYTSGAGDKLKVRIRFDTGMSRQFMASAAPLEVLEGGGR